MQGVFFRDSTRREAVRLGVAGWVRNCPDGTVEAHVEGAPDAVAALVRWARRARVTPTSTSCASARSQPEGCARFDVR